MSRFAVFIDADNVPSRIIPDLFKILKERGSIVICKVFGDFSRPNLTSWKSVCLQYNLEAVIAWHKAGKNSSDLKLCQSCVHTLYTHGNINDYVLVTGDGDFTTVIQDLKRNEKNVICMGVASNCSNILKNCCDEFILWAPPTTPASKISTRPIKRAIDAVFQRRDAVELNCGALKEHLLRVNSTFTETNYDQPSFGALLVSLGYTVTRNAGGTPFCRR